MSKELKPCPFCGGEASIERYGNSKVSTQYSCGDCGCFLETGEEWNHGERWNQRKNQHSETIEQQKQEIQLLKDALEKASLWLRVDCQFTGSPLDDEFNKLIGKGGNHE